MVTLEELDNHKKGMSEVARNARQASRSLDALVASVDEHEHRRGHPARQATATRTPTGRLFFQTDAINERRCRQACRSARPTTRSSASCMHLQETASQAAQVVLVSKDINMRIKARAMGLPAEDYFNDQVLEDTDLLYSGHRCSCRTTSGTSTARAWSRGRKQDGTYTFYRLTGPLCRRLLVNQFVYLEPRTAKRRSTRQVNEDQRQDRGPADAAAITRTSKNNVWGITARNREQNFALNLLMNPEMRFRHAARPGRHRQDAAGAGRRPDADAGSTSSTTKSS